MIEPKDCEHSLIEFDAGEKVKCVLCFTPMCWDEQARRWVPQPEQIEDL